MPAIHGTTLSPKGLAEYIDHTCLRPEATQDNIFLLCDEALEYCFKSVCVDKRWLSAVLKRLGKSSVLPVAVVSFPGGEDPTSRKCEEVGEALALGAREIDMVLNRGLLKEKNYGYAFEEVQKVVEASHGICVKVILETSELSQNEKIIACGLAKAAGAQFVKTSTGFSKAGANEQDVRLMREIVGDKFGVKASGGIRTLEDALLMIEAGASRLGTSSSVAILRRVRR